MDSKLFLTVFGTLFLAELGDKTQLATLLYAAKGSNPRWTVFAAASSALVLSTALGVLAGALISAHVSEKALSWAAGLGFIAIGVWTLVRA